MLDPESSLRLNLLRFPLIVGVVFIHIGASSVNLGEGQIGVIQQSGLVEFVTNIVSQVLARIAVPLFYLMSGYLFFVGFEWSKEGYFAKLRARSKTLLIPYLFWNSFALSTIAIAQAIPATRTYLSHRIPPIAMFSVFDFVNAIIGINSPPVAYQFWFIRDLMIVVLLAPLVKVLLDIVPIPFLAIVFFCWFAGTWPVNIPASVAVLFFACGAYLALKNTSLFALDKYGPIVAASYVPVAILDAVVINGPLDAYLHNFGIILGVAAALFATKRVAESTTLKLWLLKLSSASFFVFAVHQPLLIILKKALYVALAPVSSSMFLVLYFLVPIVVISFSVFAHHALSRVAPRLTSVITGGR
jgi:surface polysaccharide O-acyltransferase-like enzyme